MVDFSCPRGAIILNSSFVSSRQTEVRNGMKSWKAHLFSSAEWQEDMVVSDSINK
jgi:hypothetical protein